MGKGETTGPTENPENIEMVVEFFRNIKKTNRKMRPFKISQDRINIKVKHGYEEKSKYPGSKKKKFADYLIYYKKRKILVVEAKATTNYERAKKQIQTTVEIIRQHDEEEKRKNNGYINYSFDMVALIYSNKTIFNNNRFVDENHQIFKKSSSIKINDPVLICKTIPLFGFEGVKV